MDGLTVDVEVTVCSYLVAVSQRQQLLVLDVAYLSLSRRFRSAHFGEMVGFAAFPTRLSVGWTAFFLTAVLTVAVRTSAAGARRSTRTASALRRRSSFTVRRRR